MDGELFRADFEIERAEVLLLRLRRERRHVAVAVAVISLLSTSAVFGLFQLYRLPGVSLAAASTLTVFIASLLLGGGFALLTAFWSLVATERQIAEVLTRLTEEKLALPPMSAHELRRGIEREAWRPE